MHAIRTLAASLVVVTQVALVVGLVAGLVAGLSASGAHADTTAFEKSNAAFDAGDYATAATLYESMLDASPSWAAGWLRLGQSRYLAGDASGGETAIRKAAEVDPTTDLCHAFQDPANRLYRANRHDEAIAPLEQALASLGDPNDPRRASLRVTLAYAQYLAGRYPDARKSLEAHLADVGFAAEPAWYLAQSCQRLGDYPCALEQLESVAEHAGHRKLQALEKLATWSRYFAANRMGDPALLQAAAARHAEAWYRAAPSSPDAAENFGAVMLAAGRAAELAATLGARRGDANCQVALQLARAQNTLDRREAAEQSGMQALDCDPASADAWIEVAYSKTARLRPEHSELVAVLEDRALAQGALASIANARRLDPARADRERELERQLQATLETLSELEQAFERDDADYRRQIEANERDVVRQRCLNLIWVRRGETRALSDAERRFFKDRDCDQYAP